VLCVLVQDRTTGEVLGGVLGRTIARLLFIDLVFLPEALRGGGVGQRMIALAEEEALRRGCVAAVLYTISFQAPGFYEKLGYREFGRVACLPPGTSRVFMTKPLASARMRLAAEAALNGCGRRRRSCQFGIDARAPRGATIMRGRCGTGCSCPSSRFDHQAPSGLVPCNGRRDRPDDRSLHTRGAAGARGCRPWQRCSSRPRSSAVQADCQPNPPPDGAIRHMQRHRKRWVHLPTRNNLTVNVLGDATVNAGFLRHPDRRQRHGEQCRFRRERQRRRHAGDRRHRHQPPTR
jgi:hypothetical protein